MANATMVLLADALVTALNDESFSQAFTAVRSYLPAFELEDLADLRVSVVPHGQAIEKEARGIVRWQCVMDVGIQKRVDPDTLAEGDVLAALVEEMCEFLLDTRLAISGTEGIPLLTESEPFVVVEHLDAYRVFTSIIGVTYRVVRP